MAGSYPSSQHQDPAGTFPQNITPDILYFLRLMAGIQLELAIPPLSEECTVGKSGVRGH